MHALREIAPSGDTIAAVSTPRGTSQRAIVRLSGPQAEAIARRLLTAASRDALPAANYRAVTVALRLNRLLLPARLYIMRAPRSYTREDIIEMHTFGAPPLLQALMEQLVAEGARPAEPGEFTRRAFLNGRLDLAQAEAVEALIHARGEAEYRAAQGALAGRLSRRVAAIRNDLADLAAAVEVALDFSDQDVRIVSPSDVLRRAATVRGALSELIASHDAGRVDSHTVRFALFGPPNAGKSSLFNALLQRHEAIVSPQPGATRDTLEATLTFDDLEIGLVDTAGLRPPGDAVEAVAVDRSRAALGTVDFHLCVVDAASPPEPDTLEALRHIAPQRTLILLNKRDVAPCHAELSRLLPEDAPKLAVSATTGEGLDALRLWIADRLRTGRIDRAPAEFMVNARQARLMALAVQALDRVLESDCADAVMDLTANDLADALRALSDVTGSAVTEDVLDRIFSNFCIGK